MFGIVFEVVRKKAKDKAKNQRPNLKKPQFASPNHRRADRIDPEQREEAAY